MDYFSKLESALTSINKSSISANHTGTPDSNVSETTEETEFETSQESLTAADAIFQDPFALNIMAETGMPFEVFDHIQQNYPITLEEWSELLHISYKSMQRYSQKPGYIFKTNHTEVILEILQVLDLGTLFFDSQDTFRAWLTSPSMALGDKKPLHLLRNRFGIRLTLQELYRMEHGIFI
jgi:putative toxin-antitoxin system antitoxin component (TIGR02293 family)